MNPGIKSPSGLPEALRRAQEGDRRALARLLTLVENNEAANHELSGLLAKREPRALVCGVTGPPGAGKSTLIGKLAQACIADGLNPAVLAVDPSSPITGGALLGDRVRMATGTSPDYYIRSIASRGHPGGLAAVIPQAIRVVEAAGADAVFLETVGVGQADISVTAFGDVTILVVGPAGGDEIQAGKAGVLEVADIVVVNKDDLEGAAATLRALRSMLSLRATPAPAILATSAQQERGIDELWREILRTRRVSDRVRQDRHRAAAALAIGEAVRNAVASGQLTAEGAVERTISGTQSMQSLVEWFLTRLASS